MIPNPPRPGPHRYAWGPFPWYLVFSDGGRTVKRWRTRREAAQAYKALRLEKNLRRRSLGKVTR
jgi:hypothetical protein